jgi:hypothetical protein
MSAHLTPREPEVSPSASDRKDDERVPVFGTWPAIYAAVVACAIVVMGLLALFSGFSY